MKKIKTIVNNYLDAEFLVHSTGYDVNVTDESFEKYAEKYVSFFHSSYKSKLSRPKTQAYLQSSERQSLFKRKSEWMQKRKLLSIEKFTDSVIGETLGQLVNGKFLYAATLGPYENPTDENLPHQKIYLSNTDEGTKIIYTKILLDGELGHEHDSEYLQVLEDGNLLDSLKMQNEEE